MGEVNAEKSQAKAAADNAEAAVAREAARAQETQKDAEKAVRKEAAKEVAESNEKVIEEEKKETEQQQKKNAAEERVKEAEQSKAAASAAKKKAGDAFNKALKAGLKGEAKEAEKMLKVSSGVVARAQANVVKEQEAVRQAERNIKDAALAVANAKNEKTVAEGRQQNEEKNAELDKDPSPQQMPQEVNPGARNLPEHMP